MSHYAKLPDIAGIYRSRLFARSFAEVGDLASPNDHLLRRDCARPRPGENPAIQNRVQLSPFRKHSHDSCAGVCGGRDRSRFASLTHRVGNRPEELSDRGHVGDIAPVGDRGPRSEWSPAPAWAWDDGSIGHASARLLGWTQAVSVGRIANVWYRPRQPPPSHVPRPAHGLLRRVTRTHLRDPGDPPAQHRLGSGASMGPILGCHEVIRVTLSIEAPVETGGNEQSPKGCGIPGWMLT
jgi:hypothetical protein